MSSEVDSNRFAEAEEAGFEEASMISETSSSIFTSVSDKFVTIDDPDNDEESEEDELEPRLKYEKLSADLKVILANDSASCIAVHPKLMALGTHRGRAHILDVMGNSIMPSGQDSLLHSVVVNQMSIDHVGEYVAACSLDGKVTVRSIISGHLDVNFHLNKLTNSVSIDPIYASSPSNKRVMTGGDAVVLHEPTLFNRYKQKVLDTEGPISVIKWRGRFAAWGTSRGIKVWDVVDEKLVSIIKCPSQEDDCPTRIAWSDQYHLFVSIGDIVKVCVIRKRNDTERKSELPQHKVEILSTFKTDNDWVCGIAPFEDLVVLLTVPKMRDDNGQFKKPVLRVVQYQESDYSEISEDILSIRGYAKYRPKHYHLGSLAEDRHVFVVSPKDVIMGKPRDADDRVEWLLSRERYAQALQIAEENRKFLRRNSVAEVGKKYLTYLLEDAQFQKAGELCIRIFGKDKKLWQEEAFRFARLNQLKTIAPFLPTSEPVLDSEVYEITLYEYLNSDHPGLLHLIQKWPASVYSPASIVKPLVEKLLVDPNNEDLQRTLALLFSHQGKYDKAVAILIRVGHKDVFELIKEHQLYSTLTDKIPELMELDRTTAVKMFLKNMAVIPPKTVVPQLDDYRRHQFHYLDELYNSFREESRPFHDKIVPLYADFAKDKLLTFLKVSDHYQIDKALEICVEHGYIHEQIYLLTRAGNPKEALDLIVDSLYDIQMAVDFCKEQDDYELWQDLIDKVIDKPLFLNVLLNNIGTHVDPRILIQKIEKGQEIPGLRDSLVQIMTDYKLQVSLQEGCQRILVADCYSLMEKQVRILQKGVAVHEDATCSICNATPVTPKAGPSSDLIVFKCKHVFHVKCLGELNLCALCHKHRQQQSKAQDLVRP